MHLKIGISRMPLIALISPLFLLLKDVMSMLNSILSACNLLICEMKKLSKAYLKAIGQHALNTHKTQLILSNRALTEMEELYTYEENEYVIGFKLAETNDVNVWGVDYVIPSPTVDELNEMEKIASSKMQVLGNNENSYNIRFEYMGNTFEIEYSRESNGEFERGYFIPYLN